MYARLNLVVTLRFFCVLLLGLPIASAGEFTNLVQGDDPHQFELIGISPEHMAIKDGEVTLTGRPNGYFATKTPYRNYLLEFEWRYDRPADLGSDAAFHGNSGLLIHIEKPHKIWPKSIEAQLFHPDAGHVFAIRGARFQGSKNAEAQKRAVKPVGQWNQQKVLCRDGSIVCEINGVEVSRGTGAEPDRGVIGWQSEGNPIHFRNIKIKVID